MASHVHFKCVGLLCGTPCGHIVRSCGGKGRVTCKWEGVGRVGEGVGGLASTMVPGLQGCKTTWGKTHCKRSRRCQLHFHDLSVFKVTRTEVITLPSLTIVHYDHSHFLVCLFYDLIASRKHLTIRSEHHCDCKCMDCLTHNKKPWFDWPQLK